MISIRHPVCFIVSLDWVENTARREHEETAFWHLNFNYQLAR